MTRSFVDIIECWERLARASGQPRQGLRWLSEDVGQKFDAVRQWKYRNNIPSDSWLKVAGAAVVRAASADDDLRQDFEGVTVEFMAQLAEAGGTLAEAA